MKKHSKQQEQLNLSLSQEVTPANRFQSQEEKEVKMILETSGQKCLDLSRNSNLYGFLQKMLKDISNWAWMKYYMTWKAKTTPHKRLLFQLQVSVQTTKGKGYGLWATPNTMDHLPQKSKETLIRQATTIRKGRTRPSNLREQVCEETMKIWPTPNSRDWKDSTKKVPPSVGKTRGHSLGMKVAAEMWPTPTAGCVEGGEQSHRVEKTKSGGYILRKKNKKNSTFGAKLSDAILYEEKMSEKTGTLNPTWVEWLMGFPLGWTDLKQSEIQSFPKLQKSLERQLSRRKKNE